jgi:hypothetical protein
LPFSVKGAALLAALTIELPRVREPALPGRPLQVRAGYGCPLSRAAPLAGPTPVPRPPCAPVFAAGRAGRGMHEPRYERGNERPSRSGRAGVMQRRAGRPWQPPPSIPCGQTTEGLCLASRRQGWRARCLGACLCRCRPGPLHEIPPCRRDPLGQPGTSSCEERPDRTILSGHKSFRRPRPRQPDVNAAGRGEWPRQPLDQCRLPVALSGRHSAVLRSGPTALPFGCLLLLRREAASKPGVTQALVQHATGQETLLPPSHSLAGEAAGELPPVRGGPLIVPGLAQAHARLRRSSRRPFSVASPRPAGCWYAVRGSLVRVQGLRPGQSYRQTASTWPGLYTPGRSVPCGWSEAG